MRRLLASLEASEDPLAASLAVEVRSLLEIFGEADDPDSVALSIARLRAELNEREGLGHVEVTAAAVLEAATDAGEIARVLGILLEPLVPPSVGFLLAVKVPGSPIAVANTFGAGVEEVIDELLVRKLAMSVRDRASNTRD